MMTKQTFGILALLMVFGAGCTGDSEPSERAAKLAAEASTLMSDDALAEAKTKLVQASDLRPQCVEYHVGIAMCATKLGEYAVARKRYESARKLLAPQAEDDPERVDDYLMVLLCLGEDDEAKTELTMAKKRFGDHRNIRLIVDDYGSFVAQWGEFIIRD